MSVCPFVGSPFVGICPFVSTTLSVSPFVGISPFDGMVPLLVCPFVVVNTVPLSFFSFCWSLF
jgi:hypothetical protein